MFNFKRFFSVLFALLCVVALGVPAMAEGKPNLEYIVNGELYGWQPYVAEPAEAGTIGRSQHMEAIRVKSDQPLNLSYQVYVQGTGWTDPVTNDMVAGTEGQGLALEGFRASLTNGDEAKYDIRYNVYVDGAGWQGWRANGEDAGVPGEGTAIEAIQMTLEPKAATEDPQPPAEENPQPTPPADDPQPPAEEPEPETPTIVPADVPETQPELKDDFYYSANWDLLHQNSIDPTKGYWSNMDDFEPTIIERVKTILKGEDTLKPYSPEEEKLVEYYQMMVDEDSKTATGLAPFQKDLDDIMNAPDVNSLMQKIGELHYLAATQSGGELPLLSVGSEQNLADSSTYALYITEGNTLVNIRLIKAEDNQNTWNAIRQYAHDMNVAMGYDEAKASETADQVVDLLKRLTPNMGDGSFPDASQFVSEPAEYYQELFPTFDFIAFVQKAGLDTTHDFVLTSPQTLEYFKDLNSVLTEENLPVLKEYTRLAVLLKLANYLPANKRNIVKTLDQASRGASELPSVESVAYEGVKNLYTMDIDKAYCDRYVTPQDKENILQMINLLTDEYREIIKAQDWMDDETKKNALDKLDNMLIYALYPDDWTPHLEPVEVVSKEDGGTALGNSLAAIKSAYQRRLDNYFQMRDNVDRNYTINKVDTLVVNATYQPTSNAICIYTGISGGEMYSADASLSKNLGNIGSIIGHEISHAFDSNGSAYDNVGKFRNWWTDKDREEYNKRAQQIADYYSSYTVLGRPVNGQQTLGENIADLGGVRACLNVLKEQGGNLDEFFKAYASTWASLNTESRMLTMLSLDFHGPDKIRANAVVSSCPEFYETYNIQPGDGMYVAPENRVGIWK